MPRSRSARFFVAWKGKIAPAGWVMLTSLFFTALVGLDTESSISYQAFSLLASVLFVAFLCSLFFRGRFSIQRELPRFGTTGLVMAYRVSLTNLGSKDQRGLTLHEEFGNAQELLDDTIRPLKPSRLGRSFKLVRRPRPLPARVRVRPQGIPNLPAHSTVEFEAQLLPGRRGVLVFQSARIARMDPFGLLRAFRRIDQTQTVLILPKRYPVPDLQLPGREQYQLGGVTQASGIGRSEEFVSLREYRRGDPLRHIHWRSWAKCGEPIVKEFEDEFFVRHGLVLDTFAGEEEDDPEIFEEAVSLAASFACSLGTQESLLDLMFVGAKAFLFTAGRGVAHTDQLLEILAGARAIPQADFDSLSSLVFQHAGTLTACVLVFIHWDDSRRRLVEGLLRLGIPIHVFLIRGARMGREVDLGPLQASPHLLRVLRVGSIEADLGRR